MDKEDLKVNLRQQMVTQLNRDNRISWNLQKLYWILYLSSYSELYEVSVQGQSFDTRAGEITMNVEISRKPPTRFMLQFMGGSIMQINPLRLPQKRNFHARKD